jgi:hypothetical protein
MNRNNYSRVHFVRTRKQRTSSKITPKDIAYLAFVVFTVGLFLERGYSAISQTQIAKLALSEPVAPQVQAEETDYRVDYSSLDVVDVVDADERVNKLHDFLESKNSPLLPYSKLIVEQADLYDIGWTKIVAISAIESNYGRNIKENSFNAWGIMIDNQVHKFESWVEGIEYTSLLLSKRYKETEIEALKSKYCPSDDCHNEWVEIVMASSQEIRE